MRKFDAYSDARRMVEEFNSKDLPYSLEIVNLDGLDGEFIVARWRWMDATYFSGISVTDEIKEFCTYVKLEDDGSFRWFDTKTELYQKLSPKRLEFGGEAHYGKEWRYNKTIVLGRDNKINKTGIVSFTLNTKTIHQPISEWLKHNNYKKRKTTLKEHVNSFKATMNPTICSIVGIVFTIVGTIFFIIGAVIIIRALMGHYLTIEYNGSNGSGVISSQGSSISFGAFFALLSSPFIIIGPLFLKWFLPKFIKEIKEYKESKGK